MSEMLNLIYRNFAKIRSSKIKYQNDAKVSIAIGIAIGGFGALIQMRFAQSSLNDQDFARFVSWHALFAVIGSLFSAPMMILGLSIWKIAGNHHHSNNGEFQGLQILFAFLLLFVAALIGLVGYFLLSISFIYFAELIVLGSAIQMIYAIQRSLLGSAGYWSLVGIQLATEGVFRISIFGVLRIFGVDSLPLLILASILIPICPLIILARRSNNIWSTKYVKPKFKRAFNLAFPVWANSFGVLLAFSAPSVVYFLRDSSAPDHVALLGLMFSLMRIPISLAPASNAPKLVEISNKNGVLSDLNALNVWSARFKLQILYALKISILLSIVVPTTLQFLFQISVSESIFPVLVSSVSTGLFLVSQNQTTFLFGIEKQNTVLKIWLYSTLLLIIFLCIAPVNPIGVVLAVAGSSIFCASQHYFSIQKLFQVQ